MHKFIHIKQNLKIARFSHHVSTGIIVAEEKPNKQQERVPASVQKI